MNGGGDYQHRMHIRNNDMLLGLKLENSDTHVQSRQALSAIMRDESFQMQTVDKCSLKFDHYFNENENSAVDSKSVKASKKVKVLKKTKKIDKMISPRKVSNFK